jgi:outer membrane protein assembly factor BamB
MFQHAPAHTGTTNSTAPKTSPVLLWNRESHGAIEISPAIVNGVIYASASNNLYALNASTGETIWSVNNGGQTSPIFADGIVYTGAYCGTAYNASTGAEIWSIGTREFFSDTIAVSDGYFYTVAEHENFHARNATTGAVIWNSSYAVDFPFPAVANGYIYIAFNASLHAINAYNGKELWSARLGWGSPAVSSGCVYVGGDDYNLYCLNALTGQTIWNYSMKSLVSFSPAIAYGIVFAGSTDGNAYAFNASTGKKIWNCTIATDADYSRISSSPAVADGAVYISVDDGRVCAIDAYTGDKLWSYSVQTGYDSLGAQIHFLAWPAIANGNIYIMSYDHFVTVLTTAKTPPSNSYLPVIFLIIVVLLVFVVFFVLRKRKKGA